MDEKIELLRGVPLFAGCGSRELEAIRTLADEIDVPAGQVLTTEGQYGHEFFLIVRGNVRVERDGATVATLGPGEFLGEIALVDGGPRSATATTDTPARLLVLGHREFNSLLGTWPTIQASVLQALAARVRKTEPGSA